MLTNKKENGLKKRKEAGVNRNLGLIISDSNYLNELNLFESFSY